MRDNPTLIPVARRAVFEAYRREGGSHWIQATGESMRPLIKPGTWMLVRFGAPRTERGRIVLFATDEALVAHRIVATRGDGRTLALVTKGDGEAYRDAPISAADVLGTVDALSPNLGGPRRTVGCTGLTAGAVARVSLFASRLAGVGARIARLFPDPLRRPAVGAAAGLAGVVSRAGASPCAWLARTQPTPGEGR